MYIYIYVCILVEIIHTEFQYITLIEMQKYNWNRKKIEKRKTWKKGPFVPVGVTNRDKKSSFVPVARPGTKWHPLLSRPDVFSWETGTTKISQPGQISLSVVVYVCMHAQLPTCAYLLRRVFNERGCSLLVHLSPAWNFYFSNLHWHGLEQL